MSVLRLSSLPSQMVRGYACRIFHYGDKPIYQRLSDGFFSLADAADAVGIHLKKVFYTPRGARILTAVKWKTGLTEEGLYRFGELLSSRVRSRWCHPELFKAILRSFDGSFKGVAEGQSLSVGSYIDNAKDDVASAESTIRLVQLSDRLEKARSLIRAYLEAAQQLSDLQFHMDNCMTELKEMGFDPSSNTFTSIGSTEPVESIEDNKQLDLDLGDDSESDGDLDFTDDVEEESLPEPGPEPIVEVASVQPEVSPVSASGTDLYPEDPASRDIVDRCKLIIRDCPLFNTNLKDASGLLTEMLHYRAWKQVEDLLKKLHGIDIPAMMLEETNKCRENGSSPYWSSTADFITKNPSCLRLNVAKLAYVILFQKYYVSCPPATSLVTSNP
jgi:hypothetical protein